MNSRPEDMERLRHMVEAIDRINKFIGQMSYQEFLNDEMAQFAIIKNFEIIGEAAYYVAKETKKEHPEIEWRKIEAFRHKLVHDYYEIDLDIVWKSKENKINGLKEQLTQILKNPE